eukprot:725694_1
MADIHRKTNQSQMKVVATAVEAGMHQTTKALEVEAERYDVGKDLLSPPARGRGDFMSGRGDTRRGMRGRGGRGGNMHRNEGNPITREARGGMTRNRPRGARVRGGGFMTRGIRGNRGGGQGRHRRRGISHFYLQCQADDQVTCIRDMSMFIRKHSNIATPTRITCRVGHLNAKEM